MNANVPTHETLKIGALLAFTAGTLDAYTYLIHGEVFAGLQTGNIILLGIQLFHSGFNEVLHYLIPIFSFMLGVILTRIFQQRFSEHHDEHLRPIYILTTEIVLIILTAILSPYLPDRFANVLISITAAMQLQEFRKLKSGPFTSLMMTGNLRTLAESAYDGISQKNQRALEKAADTFTIIVSFVFGAVITRFFAPIFVEKTVLIAIISLGIAVIILVHDHEYKKI